MQFSLEHRTVTLSVGEFAAFTLGPQETGDGGPQGIWRAQLGQHWHTELRARTQAADTAAQFEVPIEGRLVHKGWAFTLAGRIDQLTGGTLREIKTVMRPLPADETALRTEYPEYFLQLGAYVVLRRTFGHPPASAELVFVEPGTGVVQTVALTPFDEALVFHQLEALTEFLNEQLRATTRRRALTYRPPFTELRPGQETIQRDLGTAMDTTPVVLFEAPTGYGKTGCVLDYALGQLKSGRFARLIWLTGKSTGQLQVVRTLQHMTTPTCNLIGYKSTAPTATGTEMKPHLDCPIALPYWQVRNKQEHCVNDVFHCVRDACGYLAGCAERWPGSGLAKFYLDDRQPRDLDTVRSAGRGACICPYEITRAALAFNDVWIGDYNYVFAPDNRGIFFDQPGFTSRETLLVIDEAHNLPSRVADAYSHSAHEADARALLAELDHLNAPTALVRALEEWVMLLGGIEPSDGLDPMLEAELHTALVQLAELVQTTPLDYAALGPQHAETLWQFPALLGFLDDTNLRKLLWAPAAGELAFTCIDASEAIAATLRQFGGAILMSATLTPFANNAEAFGLPRNTEAETHYTTLRAPAPWREQAYDIAVDLRVDTTYRHRGSHYATTADTIVTMQAAAGTCVAVFFPSYAYAEAVLRAMEHHHAPLRVAMQPKLPDLAAQTAWVEENLALADALFLVLGSSFAEGIDLLGGRVTHAMVVGPALPEVNAVQKARMETFGELGRDGAFRRVYQMPGLQKVNQALGRLVRAPGQRAKVLLHCRRFAETSYATLLASEYQLYRELGTDAELHAWLGQAMG